MLACMKPVRARPLTSRALLVCVLAACGLAFGACGSGAVVTPRSSLIMETRDPETASALLRIARIFNDDYQENKDVAVYDRWDAASQRIISRATFLRRHHDCPLSSHVAVDTWGVSRGPGHWWLVHYSIDGQQFTDWWHYVDGRFVFDLFRSNPSAVSLYRSSPARYAKATGCAG
jgi:hypothetical protein